MGIKKNKDYLILVRNQKIIFQKRGLKEVKKVKIFLLVGLSLLLGSSLSLAQIQISSNEESENIIVAVGTEGLDIFEVNDPTKPKHLSHLNLEYAANDVYLEDNYAYVADSDNGLVIVDVSNPIEPKVVGHYYTGWAEDVYIKDNYAYVAVGDNGLVILDINDPTAVSYTHLTLPTILRV